MVLPRRPRLAFAFTVLPGESAITLVAGEDVRYTLEGRELERWAPALLARLDGRASVDELLATLPPGLHAGARELLETLAGERALVEGTAAEAHRPARRRLSVRGTGPLRAALDAREGESPEVVVFCQDRLDVDEARDCARRCRESGATLLWATIAPLARAYVSPALLPDAGPCLGCLLDNFARRAPLPGLDEALRAHAAAGGELAAAPAGTGVVAALRGLVEWKLEQLERELPAPELYQLHVLECASFEIGCHRVRRDPECPDCGAP